MSGWRKSGAAYDAAVFSDPRHDALAPFKEIMHGVSCAEQILQTTLKSKLAGGVLSADPLNTYSEPVAFPSTTILSASSTAPSITAVVVDEGFTGPWLSGVFQIVVDPSAMTAKVSSDKGGATYAFSMTDSLSNKIPLADSAYLRLMGTLPEDSFDVSAEALRPFRRSILEPLASLKGLPWNRPDLKRIFDSSLDPVDRLAAAAVDMCAGYGFDYPAI